MVMINIASIHYFSGANLDTDFDADGVPTRPEHGNASNHNLVLRL